MTVEELRSRLASLPADAQVLGYDGDGAEPASESGHAGIIVLEPGDGWKELTFICTPEPEVRA